MSKETSWWPWVAKLGVSMLSQFQGLCMHINTFRNKWKGFAIAEFIHLFSPLIKIDEFDIDKFETGMLDTSQDDQYVRDLRLALIKSLSSNRTISPENMDDFIRRQYAYRRVSPNPMLLVQRVWREIGETDNQVPSDDDSDSVLGDVEEVEEQKLITWVELTINERLSVLHDLCEWHLASDRFRERAEMLLEVHPLDWRLQHIGEDSEDQLYYFSKSCRLYRSSNPASRLVHVIPKNKKRKRTIEDDPEPTSIITYRNYDDDMECLAVTNEDWHDYVKALGKASTTNEKALFSYLRNEALPVVAEMEEEKQRKLAAIKAKAERQEAERLRELMRLESMATRKRSSRIQLIDERKKEEEAKAAAQRRIEELKERAREQQRRAEKAASQPMIPAVRMTREGRAKERELRDYLNDYSGANSARGSSRGSSNIPRQSRYDMNETTNPKQADSLPHVVGQQEPIVAKDQVQPAPIASVEHDHTMSTPNGTAPASEPRPCSETSLRPQADMQGESQRFPGVCEIEIGANGSSHTLPQGAKETMTESETPLTAQGWYAQPTTEENSAETFSSGPATFSMTPGDVAASTDCHREPVHEASVVENNVEPTSKNATDTPATPTQPR